MGIISALLTGGTLIGKVCQALSGSLSTVKDEESGTVVSLANNFTCCGIKMMKINSAPYMLNTLELPVDVTVPNIATGNTLTYTVGAGEKQDITALMNSNISPETEILIGPVESDIQGGRTDGSGKNALKMSFNKLEIGGSPVYVGGYGITADTDKLTVNTIDTLPTLNYTSFRSDKGVSFVNTEQIQGNNNVFAIPLSEYGFDRGDVVSGSIYFSLDGYKKDFLCENAVKSEPLTEAEKKCLEKLGISLKQ